MAETELTVEVREAYDDAKKKLEKRGFKIIREVVMEDVYLANLAESEIMEANTKSLINASILVRTLTNSDFKTKTLVVYKDKKYDENGRVVEEEKTQTEVADKYKLIKILTSARLKKWFEMKTILHVLSNGNREVCLQEVENLGLFLEYEEDDSHKNLSLNDKIAVMKGEINSLGLMVGEDYFVKKLELLRNKQLEQGEN